MAWLLILLWTAVVHPIVSKLWEVVVEKGVENLLTLVVDTNSVEEKLTKVKERANRIKVMLEDAEERRYIVRKDVLHRLSELRGVAFDVDDLAEEFEIRKDEGTHRRIMWLWYCSRVSQEIDDIDQRIGRIVSDGDKIDRSLKEAPKISNSTLELPPESGSDQDPTVHVYGRGSIISDVVEWLLKTSSGARGIPVFSIEGVGGIGKTTLARNIFADSRVVANEFKRIWIDLSQGFDATRTIKEIIKYLSNGAECPSLSLDMLQQRLKVLLQNNKFLLVLDNVWQEDFYFWDTLHAPLSAGRAGSKVLMTTRSRPVSQYMHASRIIVLDRLETENVWQVLRDQSQVNVDNLLDIGKSIAAKCDGSPLAAKLLGRFLRDNRSKEHWQDVLDEMPDPEEVSKTTLPALKLSYDRLPLHLKRCFAYCSIYPDGYEFDKDEIVHLWMAEGLIKSKRPRENIQTEDIGRKHFDDLLRRSFFQPANSNQEYKEKYQMHNLIHDLARSVSRFECLSVNHLVTQQDHNADKNPRYALLSYRTKQLENLWLVCKKKRLSTLILHNICTLSAGEHDLAVTKVPSKLLMLKRLRVLDMSYSQLEELPDSIGDLIHLRYLGLRGTWLRTLPKTVKGLRKLQNLELGECHKLKALPKEICSLTILRHLGLHLDWENWDRSSDHLNSMPPGIGKLTNLQTLSRFSVATDEDCRIDQLGKLTNLRGELCISNLECVMDKRESVKANLSEKPKINFLMLCWSSKSMIESANSVISGLNPHTNLKSLMIENYAGTEFPVWMEDGTLVNLETLRLYNSKTCRMLPRLANLPRLKNLYIKGFHEVKRIHNPGSIVDNSDIGFPSLEVLHLSDMNELEALFVTQDDDILPRLPSSLRKLELWSCPKLIFDPSTSAPSLEDLVICGVNWAIVSWLLQLRSLRSLTILEIPGLKHILARFTRGLSNLQILKIRSCIELKSLGLPPTPSGRLEIMISRCDLLEQFCRTNGINFTLLEDTYQH